MKERPIIFSGWAISKLLDGSKTQTRRVIKPRLISTFKDDLPGAICPARVSGWVAWYPGTEPGLAEFTQKAYELGFECPYGRAGDRLWVRETWCPLQDIDSCAREGEPIEIAYKADWDADDIDREDARYCGVDRWRSPIYMPRWVSRITLEITAVRVERLQDITPIDCLAEGMERRLTVTPCRMFVISWDSLNAKRGYGWDTNPWVWVLEFRRVEP